MIHTIGSDLIPRRFSWFGTDSQRGLWLVTDRLLSLVFILIAAQFGWLNLTNDCGRVVLFVHM